MYNKIYKFRFWISGGILLVLGTCFLGALVKKTGVFSLPRADEDSLLSRAREYYLSGDYVEAADVYEKVLVLEPDRASVYLDLAIIYDDYIGNRDQAIKLYRKYLELQPDSEKKELVEEWIQQAERRLLGVPRSGSKAMGERLLIIQEEMEIIKAEKMKLETEVERLSGTLYNIQADQQKELQEFQKQREKLAGELNSSRTRINKLSQELKKAEKSRQKLQEELLAIEKADEDLDYYLDRRERKSNSGRTKTSSSSRSKSTAKPVKKSKSVSEFIEEQEEFSASEKEEGLDD